MTGGDDPDCRKPLWWPEFAFEPEYRNNFQPGKKEYDEVGFNPAHLDFYKKVIRLRKDNPVLVDGSFEFLVAEGKKLAYKRKNDKDEIIVVFNLEDGPQTFALPEGESFINLLNNENASGSVSHGPLSAGVYKRVN
jgi:glycosidase